jgi:uncharacterized membrane protein YtjA (UPF0391 family)
MGAVLSGQQNVPPSLESCRTHWERYMVIAGLGFWLIALLAGVLGFPDIAAVAATIAEILSGIAAALFLGLLAWGTLGDRMVARP